MRHRPVKVWQDCPHCNGLGERYPDGDEYEKPIECGYCQGSGKVEADAPEPEFEKDDND